jgi:membrane-associated phospholipid phosphatase
MIKGKYFQILFQVIVVIVIAYLVSSGLKLLFGIPRPCELLESCPESFSFPSRHTTVFFATATLLSFYISSRFLKYLVFILAGAVALWRVLAGLHTIQDVVGGAILGIVVGMLVFNIFNKFKSKSRRR